MSTTKIIYGIDLGTTNSAITRFENGKAVVKKNALQMDTTPSCVAYTRNGKVLVGTKAHAQLEKDYALSFRKTGYKSNTFIEFKRLMGTDYKYECSSLGHEISPEDLSAEVLKELRKNILDENVTSAVITVPAMFNNTQKDATKRAAKLAGFEHVELIQEPVAASVAYGLDSKMKNAYWVVFDFGGGTFDAALMRIQDGIMQAIDTAGNNKLGGKDIDNAILDEIILPYLKSNFTLDDTIASKGKQFRDMWKAKAEEAKIGLSRYESVDIETDLGDDYGTDDFGEELSLSLTLTRDDLERVAAPIFQKAIDITNAMLQKNHIDGNALGALILVGGPTYSPILRKMIMEQVTANVDTSIDPMTCVAAGAAIYGSTLDMPKEVVDATRDRSKVQLELGYQSTSVEEEEWVSVSLLADKSDNYHENSVQVEFARADGMFTTPKANVDTRGDVVSLRLKPDDTNVFAVCCYDNRGNRLECEPNEITIIQGVSGLGDAVLPLALGLGTTNADGIEVFEQIEGLEKSRKLPASGEIRGLRLPKDIHPGVMSDELRLSIYQTDEVTPNTRVLYCQRIYDVILNGGDIPGFLPEDSIVNLKFHAERSGTIDSFEVEIPALEIVIDMTDRMSNSTTSVPSASFMAREFSNANRLARELNIVTLIKRLDSAEQRYHSADGDRDIIDGVLSELQYICRDIDREYSLGAWEREELRVRGMYNELIEDNRKHGNLETTRLVEQLKGDVDRVLASRNVQLARDLFDQLWNIDYDIAEVEFYIVWIYDWNRDFDKKGWTNRSKARDLIDLGLRKINSSPTIAELKPIAFEILNLLPENQKPDTLVRKGK